MKQEKQRKRGEEMDLLKELKEEQLPEDQRRISEVIGMEAYQKLVRTFSGSMLYIPKAESLERAVRDERIRKEFTGNNYRELSRKYGLTENWVRAIVAERAKELRSAPVEGQMTIFDILTG